MANNTRLFQTLNDMEAIKPDLKRSILLQFGDAEQWIMEVIDHARYKEDKKIRIQANHSIAYTQYELVLEDAEIPERYRDIFQGATHANIHIGLFHQATTNGDYTSDCVKFNAQVVTNNKIYPFTDDQYSWGGKYFLAGLIQNMYYEQNQSEFRSKQLSFKILINKEQ